MELTNKRIIAESELIINEDGSVFHLHLKPEQLCDKIIVVGDPGRVSLVASFFDSQDFEVSNREFHTIGGTYKGTKIMCLSHGIGSDNIDIVINELDALANINFTTRMVKDTTRQLSIVRIGTSGGLQPDTPIGSYVIADKAIGFDGVLNFYANRNKVCDLALENELTKFVNWNELWAKPYVVDADSDLVRRIGKDDMIKGTTIAAVGFYGPQGREIRLPLACPDLNAKLVKFNYMGRHITNYEMESAALQGLAKLMGHKAMTVCHIIASRYETTANVSYKNSFPQLIKTVLDRFV